MNIFSQINCCRICKNADLINVIDLGDQVISSRFPNSDELDPPTIPLALVKCNDSQNSEHCGLVQLKHNINADELYLHQYGYRSGLNNTMRTHLGNMVKEIEGQIELKNEDIVLDIGSNDCTLLKSYQTSGLKRIGIDPTGTQFKEFYPSDVVLVPDFFTEVNFKKAFPTEKAKVITSISMFYDLPDPLGFMTDIYNILADDGIWVMEQSYIITMLERNSFDTICHEHLEYYAYKQISWMADKVGFNIVNVVLNDCNGGSFRLTLSKDVSRSKLNHDKIMKFVSDEDKMNLSHLETYSSFNERCSKLKSGLVNFLTNLKASGKSIYLYGASTKGNTLLQYYNIDTSLITAAAERNPDKYGRRTPKTGIPIISEAEMRNQKPDYLLVLPWHFKEEFLSREVDYLNQGGQYIFPLPVVDVVRKKKSALITGISGQIGTYLAKALLERDYLVYGQTRNLSKLKYNNSNNSSSSNNNSSVHYVECDIMDPVALRELIFMIKPDVIYHLAAETNAIESIAHPTESVFLNGNIVLHLCQIIKDFQYEYGDAGGTRGVNKIKLIVTNSSEIFKGHGGVMTENSLNFYPKNPYAIGKITAYWAMRYYRENYGLFCANAIIFNTESPLRRDTYVTQKIVKGLKKIVSEGSGVLTMGNIDQTRDWVHAFDVVSGLILMSEQVSSSDYIISGGKSHSIRDFITIVSNQLNHSITWNGEGEKECAMDSDGKVVITIDPALYRNYEPSVSLVGDISKMKSIGWRPRYTLESLIEDMINK